jgi:predicted esterase
MLRAIPQKPPIPPTVLAISLVLFCSFPVTAQRINGELDRLKKEWQKAYENHDFAHAIEIGLDLVQRNPTDPQPAYNLACSYAQNDDYDQSVQWLKSSADRGFSFLSTVLRDEDLDEIRTREGYAAALDLIRKNNAAELEKFKARADKAIIITVLPPNPDRTKPAPLIVALHGYGSDANDMATLWREAAAKIGAVLIAPQAIQPAGKGFSWGVVEQGEFLVLRAIEKARAEHNIDSRRIILTGFSQGGAMCFTLAVRHPDVFAGVIPVAGSYDHRVDPIPSQHGSKLPRFVIMVGDRDEPLENNRDAANRLKNNGAPALLKVYPNLGHTFPPNRQAEMDSALKFILQP